MTVQTAVPIIYDDIHIDVGYRADLLVNECVLVELKAVKALHPIHEAQALSCMKLGGYHVGLLINFHVVHLRDGIKRLVNNL